MRTAIKAAIQVKEGTEKKEREKRNYHQTKEPLKQEGPTENCKALEEAYQRKTYLKA